MNEFNALESRWPSALALFAVGGLHLTLPAQMQLGPPWLLLALVSTLLVPTTLAVLVGRGINRL